MLTATSYTLSQGALPHQGLRGPQQTQHGTLESVTPPPPPPSGQFRVGVFVRNLSNHHLRSRQSRKPTVKVSEVTPFCAWCYEVLVGATVSGSTGYLYTRNPSMPVEHASNRLFAPEGTYDLYSERHSGLQYFSSSRATKLTFADLLSKEEGYHVVFNVQDYLHICSYSSTGKVRQLVLMIWLPRAQCTVLVAFVTASPHTLFFDNRITCS